MLKKKPSEKIVETTIRKQSVKTLHTEDLETKALALVKQFESRDKFLSKDKFQKLATAISEAELAIKRKIDAGCYYAPYVPLATLLHDFDFGVRGDDDTVLHDSGITIDPDNPEPWFSSIPAWRPTKPTDVVEVSEPWFAPAGFKRGEASALDDVDIRRTYLWVQKQLEAVLQMNMFELNDEITREHISQAIAQIIEPVAYDFTVICDATNNTQFTVDQNILNVDVCIKPHKNAEFVHVHGEASYRGIECAHQNIYDFVQ